MNDLFQGKISEKYAEFLEELARTDRTILPAEISKAIYYDLFKIHKSLLKYKEKMTRKKSSSISDVFQDIIAHYLRNSLNNDYKISLEEKKDKFQPDILIKKQGKPWSAIEIKTGIGWNRELGKDEAYLSRLILLSKTFDIPLQRCFYIFEGAWDFSEGILDKNESVLPLFKVIFEKSDFNTTEISDEMIYTKAERNIIIDFSDIINRIKQE